MAAPWIDIALKYLGTKEVKGPQHNPLIVRWLIALRAWWSDDETPWCGTFVATVLKEAGVAYAKDWYRALAWKDWGTPLPNPMVGCIVVFSRTGGGHVGFVIGKTSTGDLVVLGGNQGDTVSIATFKRDRAVAYRWPYGQPLGSFRLPITASATPSTSEA